MDEEKLKIVVLEKNNEKLIPNNSMGSTYIPFPYSYATEILNPDSLKNSNK